MSNVSSYSKILQLKLLDHYMKSWYLYYIFSHKISIQQRDLFLLVLQQNHLMQLSKFVSEKKINGLPKVTKSFKSRVIIKPHTSQVRSMLFSFFLCLKGSFVFFPKLCLNFILLHSRMWNAALSQRGFGFTVWGLFFSSIILNF